MVCTLTPRDERGISLRGVRHSHHFTLEEARAELPWVESKLAALRDARDRLTDTEARQALADGSPTNGGGHPGKKVGEAFVELQNGIAAFDQRGIILRDLDSGLIDFPSVREARRSTCAGSTASPTSASGTNSTRATRAAARSRSSPSARSVATPA